MNSRTKMNLARLILYAEHKQLKLNEKGRKTGKALHVISVYSSGIPRKLQQDIENNPIITYQLTDLGYLSLCNFGNFLASVLVAVHAVKSLNLEQQKEYYES